MGPVAVRFGYGAAFATAGGAKLLGLIAYLAVERQQVVPI